MSESKHTQGPWEVHKMTSTYQIPIWAESKWIGNIDAGIDADIAEANARLIAAAPETKDQRDELLKACKAQHEAIDRLFALLISHDSGFFPSKSGQPWQAILQGNAAIAEAEKQA